MVPRHLLSAMPRRSVVRDAAQGEKVRELEVALDVANRQLHRHRKQSVANEAAFEAKLRKHKQNSSKLTEAFKAAKLAKDVLETRSADETRRLAAAEARSAALANELAEHSVRSEAAAHAEAQATAEADVAREAEAKQDTVVTPGLEPHTASSMSDLEAAVYASVGAASLEAQRRFVSRSCARDIVSLLIADSASDGGDDAAIDRLVALFRTDLAVALEAELDVRLRAVRVEGENGAAAAVAAAAAPPPPPPRSSQLAGLAAAFAGQKLSDMLAILEEYGGEDRQFDEAAFEEGMNALIDTSDVALAAQVGGICETLFEIFDIDGDGIVNFDELSAGISMLSHSASEHKARAIFNLFDFDSVGFISEAELARFLSTYYPLSFALSGGGGAAAGAVGTASGQYTDALAQRSARALFAEIDSTGSGAIDFDQFRRCVELIPTVERPSRVVRAGLRAGAAAAAHLPLPGPTAGDAASRTTTQTAHATHDFNVASLVGRSPAEVRLATADLVASAQTHCLWATGLPLDGDLVDGLAPLVEDGVVSETRRVQALIKRMQPLLADIDVLLVVAVDASQAAQIEARAQRRSHSPTQRRRAAPAEKRSSSVGRLVVVAAQPGKDHGAEQAARRLTTAFRSRSRLGRGAFPCAVWRAV